MTFDDEDQPLAPGTPVDRYVVERVLGRGGMATVYRVRHRQLDTIHAIKLLSYGGPQVRKRLLAEGKVQASMRHPNIVSVSDVIEHEGALGLVLEYVEGVALDRWLERHRPTLAQADVIARGILRGVASAHAAGVVHRDIKPANVMLAVHGDHLVPKVADFGLVKLNDTRGYNATRTGTAMGTPAYMAPEQISDASSVDGRADVFSLGALLYELVTGRMAFHAEDIGPLFVKVSTASYTPARQLVPDLPDRMDDAIRGAIVADRDRRIPSVGRLLELWCGSVSDADVSRAFLSLPPIFDADSLASARPEPDAPPAPAETTLPPEPQGAPRPPDALKLSSLPDWLASPPPAGPPTLSSTPPVEPVPVAVASAAPAPREAGVSAEPLEPLPSPAWRVPAAVAGLVALVVVVAGLGWVATHRVEPVPEPAPAAVAAAPVPVAAPVPAPEPAPVVASAAPIAEAPAAKAAPSPVAPTRAKVAPAPAAAPVEVAPAPAPVAAPAPDPEPAPAPTSTAWTVSGDVKRVYLESPGGDSSGPGPIAPGTYTVVAYFDDVQPTRSKTVRVEPGATLRLTCARAQRICR